MKSQLLLLLLVSLALTIGGCSQAVSVDAPTVQGRREFEMMKYRDPQIGGIPDGIRDRELAFAKNLLAVQNNSKAVEDVQSFGEWTHRGPWNIGGRTRTIVRSSIDTNVLLAGAVSGGIWRSSDGGNTWSLRTRPDQLHSVMSIVQDSRSVKGHTWYYSTGEIWGNSAQISGNGIWKSTDDGVSWELMPSTSSSTIPASGPFAYTWRMAARQHIDSSDLYVATARAGIYQSRDGARSWVPVLSSNALFSDVLVTPNKTIYAAFSGFTGQVGSVSSRWGVFRSVDGITWQNVTPPDMTNSVRRIVLTAVPQHPEQVWAIAETPGQGAEGSTTYRGELRYEWHSLWKYTRTTADTGRWENLSSNIPLREESRGDFYSQGGYDLLIRVSPHDSNVVFVGGTNLYRSTDGFRTPLHTWVGGYWKNTPKWDRYSSYGDHHPDQHDVLFHPFKPNELISVNDGGIQKTTALLADSIVWIDLNRGYLTTQFYTVDVDKRPSKQTIVGGMQDNATWASDSMRGDYTWRRLGGGDGAYAYIADSGRSEYYSSQQGRMYLIRRNDQGAEVSRARIDPGGNDYLFINPYAIHPVQEHVVYLAAGSVLMRNSNVLDIPTDVNDSTKVNWDTLQTTKETESTISAVCVVAPDGSADHVVYYGTSAGAIRRINGAQQGQPLVETVTGSTMPRGGFVNSISANPEDANHLVVCFSNYGVVSIWETRDGGKTWEAISGNLEERVNGSGNGPAVNWVAIQPNGGRPNLYVAATSTGIYFTPQTFGMATVWTSTADSLVGNVQTDMVVARSADGLFVVGTHGRGVVQGKITSLPPVPQPPTLLSPVSGSRGIHPDTTLTWNASDGAGTYRVRLWKLDTPDSVREFTVAAPVTSVAIDNLLQGPISYGWSVEAYGGGGASGPSSVWTFTTAVRPPMLLQPAAGATDVRTPTLVWQRESAALTYGIEVGANLTFNPIVFKVDQHVDTTLVLSGLESNKRYFWRVRSEDADTVGVFSPRQSFVTGIVSTVADADAKPTNGVSLEPNPASNTVRLCVRNADPNFRAEIFSANGTLVQMMNGRDCASVSVSSLSAGHYTVRVTVGAQSYTTTLVVQR